MFWKKDAEVLIVGAGPVGQFAALRLAERGVRVQVIDEQFRPTARSYALALHPRSLELLDEVGLATAATERGHTLNAIALYEGATRQAEVKLGALGSRFPHLVVISQHDLETTLEDRLREKKINVDWNHRLYELKLEHNHAAATIQRLSKQSAGYSVATYDWVVDSEFGTRVPFVVGADGHRSMVRKRLGITFEEAGPSQVFAVYEFMCDRPPLDEVRLSIDPAGTTVLWPLGDGRFRFSFEIEGTGALEMRREKSRLFALIGDQSFNYLEPRDLERLIAERAPWFEGKPGEVLWSMAVRFERRLASGWGRQNVWLAGDAVHLAPPASVLSMNVGLREAAALSDRLVQVLRESAPIERLEGYGREFHAEWRNLLEPRFDASGATPWVRKHASQIVESLPASGPERARLLEELGIVLSR